MQIHGSSSPSYARGAQKTAHILNKTNNQLKKILEKLATGQRINRASDDAAGLGISEQLRSNIRGFKMASQNVQDAMSALTIADGAASEVTDILQRQRELTISSRNSTRTDTDRQAIESEYQALNQELARLSQGTEYNRQNVADGTDLASGTATVQAGADATDQVQLPAVNLGAATAIVASSSVATAADAQTALSSIDDALKQLNQQRSTVGATINTFVSTVDNLSVAMVNTQAAESVLRDQDMAQGIVDLTRQRLLQEGSTSAFQRFNEINRNNIMGILG